MIRKSPTLRMRHWRRTARAHPLFQFDTFNGSASEGVHAQKPHQVGSRK